MCVGVVLAIVSGSSWLRADPRPFESAEAVAAAAALVGVKVNDAPDKVYGAFNAFCKTHFGAAADPLVYERFGNDLRLIEAGAWRHVSANSATLAWETNLPAVSYVEYGETADYGQRTPPTDRPYFLHNHALIGLPKDRTFHYRIVATDERGNVSKSPDQTFQTRMPEGGIALRGSADGSPLELNEAGATYVLTEDVTASGAGIVTLRDDITLDLNGHTIVFASNPASPKAVHGVIARGTHDKSKVPYNSTGLKLLNGTIRQGEGKLLDDNKEALSFNPVFVTGQDAEIAGLRIYYHAPQSWGMQLNHANGKLNIHHNVFRDSGTKIPNRHGAGVRSIGFRLPRSSPNDFTIRHNLIERTRQNGIGGAHSMFGNEIYVDSWSTNSFAIQPESKEGVDAGEHFGNRIFAAGFNAYGFGWAHENLTIRDNLIMMFGLDVKDRWNERWGDVNLLAGMRVTNYGKGGQVRNNLRYSGNLILMRGKQGAQMQGVRFFSDETVSGLVFENNTVKVESLDEKTNMAAPIVAQGHHTKLESKPVVYRNNRLIGNHTIVQFGDSYGKGNNHHFENCQFIKIGSNPDFRTFDFAGGFFNLGHVIVDGRFEGGAKIEDVRWSDTGSRSAYDVAWTLTVQTAPNVEVKVSDSQGNEMSSVKADPNGKATLQLTQFTIRPIEWTANDPADALRAAASKTEHQRVEKGPYSVSAQVDRKAVSKTVTMDGPQQLELR